MSENRPGMGTPGMPGCNTPCVCDSAAPVYQAGFAVDDARLYLDTHPCDSQAFAAFARYQKLYEQAHELYVENVGPLFSADSLAAGRWTWTETPWPWQMED